MKLLRDTWLIFSRQVTQSLRSPVWLIMGLFQLAGLVVILLVRQRMVLAATMGVGKR